MRRSLRPLILFLGTGFLFHLAWEVLQAPLYTCFADFWRCIWFCFKAASTGDVLMMLVIYLALGIVHRDLAWAQEKKNYDHPATWLIPVIVGTLLAVSYEFWAVYVVHRWQYAHSMPLVPILRVGLLPVLQMIVVPLATLLTCRRAAKLQESR